MCSCAGSFSDDRLDGTGVYYYANGDIYSGAFKASKKHGSGQMFFKVRALAWEEAASAVCASALRRVPSVTVEAMRLAAAACHFLRRTSTKRAATQLSWCVAGGCVCAVLAGAELHVHWCLG